MTDSPTVLAVTGCLKSAPLIGLSQVASQGGFGGQRWPLPMRDRSDYIHAGHAFSKRHFVAERFGGSVRRKRRAGQEILSPGKGRLAIMLGAILAVGTNDIAFVSSTRKEQARTLSGTEFRMAQRASTNAIMALARGLGTGDFVPQLASTIFVLETKQERRHHVTRSTTDQKFSE